MIQNNSISPYWGIHGDTFVVRCDLALEFLASRVNVWRPNLLPTQASPSKVALTTKLRSGAWSITIDRYFGLFNKSIIELKNKLLGTTPLFANHHKQQF